MICGCFDKYKTFYNSFIFFFFISKKKNKIRANTKIKSIENIPHFMRSAKKKQQIRIAAVSSLYFLTVMHYTHGFRIHCLSTLSSAIMNTNYECFLRCKCMCVRSATASEMCILCLCNILRIMRVFFIQSVFRFSLGILFKHNYVMNCKRL